MLAITGLSYRYPGSERSALESVTLAAERGEVLGLLGPNGAGKTTLMSHLAGLLAIQHGDIRVEGVALAELRARAPTSIALAPQEHAWYPMLSVAENMACFAAASRLDSARRRARIDACLSFAQIEHVRNVRAERLSGGLKRRLNLALALLPEPGLMLFDEPTVGVDPQTRAFVLDAIKRLAAQGAAVICSSHYMEEIEAIADRVAILDHGRVLREGTLERLLDGGASRLSLVASGLSADALRALVARFGEVCGCGTRLDVALHQGRSAAALFAALDEAGATVVHAELGRRNLEQLFLSLTGHPLRD